MSQHLPGEEGKATADRGIASAKARGRGGAGVREVCGGEASTWISSLGGVLVHFALPICQCLEADHRVCYIPPWWLQGHCPYSGMAPNICDSSNTPGPAAVLDTAERRFAWGPFGARFCGFMAVTEVIPHRQNPPDPFPGPLGHGGGASHPLL